jgi:hypothetical protein
MDKLIAMLQNLFSLTKVASVSLPGLVSALGLAMLLWPAMPEDFIPTVDDPRTVQFDPPPRPEACPITLKPLQLLQHHGLSDIKDTQIKNQSTLEQQKNIFPKCINIESSRQGYEKSENDRLTAEIAQKQKILDAAQENFLAYSKSNSPLAAHFARQRQDAEEEITARRKLIEDNEQSIRDRDLRIKELTRMAAIIDARLADPGRLRPRGSFDDILAGLANHVVAFILLSLALGLVVTPLNQAAASVLYLRLRGDS